MTLLLFSNPHCWGSQPQCVGMTQEGCDDTYHRYAAVTENLSRHNTTATLCKDAAKTWAEGNQRRDISTLTRHAQSKPLPSDAASPNPQPSHAAKSAPVPLVDWPSIKAPCTTHAAYSAGWFCRWRCAPESMLQVQASTHPAMLQACRSNKTQQQTLCLLYACCPFWSSIQQ